MNKQNADILLYLSQEQYENQRIVAEQTGYSIGTVNKSIKELVSAGNLDENFNLSNKAKMTIKCSSPKNAIILAAGFGMRMVPINTQISKALIEINGEPIIEHTIKQLHEIGITNIYVVVGFMQEQFEYLIDLYGVELIVNDRYSEKNNLHSLMLASKYISNTYVIPCDIYCYNNPFSKQEIYSWYMVNNSTDSDSRVRVNRKGELVLSDDINLGNTMIGIAYLTGKQADVVQSKLLKFDAMKKYDDAFWEETLFEDEKMIVFAKIINEEDASEINTYEQLREIDEESNHLKSDAINAILTSLNAKQNEIVDIEVLKKGMTNRSFIFRCKCNRYIMRIPGEGTDRLINRYEEKEVYDVLSGKNISDDIIFFNAEHGYKITRFIEDSRVCDADNQEDLIMCMKALKNLHDQKLEVKHKFDIFKQIEFYESLWGDNKSVFRDYEITKKNVFELREFIENNVENECLSHIDAVPDNFLITKDGQVKLIDWEYAGMQDPHVDIAMFCIYALYDRNQVDNLIDIYFEGECKQNVRVKIYCYIAACGLLWSNWCEYKRSLGVEFGEYALRQYRYAKEYYRLYKQIEGEIISDK